MFKTIIKNIWRHRRNNAWLFAELILVAIISLMMIDPVVVSLYNSHLPTGYDSDRLYLARITGIASTSADYDQKIENSKDRKTEDIRHLASLFRNMPEVEMASILTYFSYPESNGMSSRQLITDDKSLYVNYMGYLAGQKYFETWGIGSVPGYDSVEAVSEMTTGINDVIITRSIAEEVWPGESAVGKTFVDDSDKNTTMRVVGVVDNVRQFKSNPGTRCMWQSIALNPEFLPQIIIRLKSGVSHKDFEESLAAIVKERMRSGNMTVSSVESFDEYSDQTAANLTVESRRMMKMTLLIFFLVNLALGVIGTFMLQTRRRVGEMAVMKVFGANRRNIVTMLLGESLVLSFCGWLTGCLIYLQYAVKNGLEGLTPGSTPDVSNWVTDFPIHFIVISLATLALMWVVITIGTLVPALNISRIAPVDALRDE